MKFLEAYIPPDALDDVRGLLARQGIDDLVAYETVVRIAEDDRLQWESPWSDFVPQIKLEMAVADERAAPAAQAIFDNVSARRTRRRVQILISPLDDLVSIETGRHGLAAL